jgi:transcriptional regulator GlxA family with amidase domain
MKVPSTPRPRPERQPPAKDLAAEQREFFARMMPGAFTTLFTGLEGVTFFIKDREGRFMGFSSGARQCLDFGAESEILGQTDYDTYPRNVAERLIADDQRVMTSRQPLLNIVELLVNPARCAIGWYVTNKFPVFDAQDRVIGVMGTVQHYEGRRRKLLDGTRLDAVVERIRSRPADDHPVTELAQLAAMSPRQLGRHFQNVLGMSPRDFIMLCRMKAACEALVDPYRQAGDIAEHCGFCDQSAFAYQFRRSIGMSPSEYRRRYLSASAAKRK